MVLFSANIDCAVVVGDLRKCSQVSALTQFWRICVGFQKCIHGHPFESLSSVPTLENRMYVWVVYAFDIYFWKEPLCFSHLSKLSLIFTLFKLSCNKLLLSSFCVSVPGYIEIEINGILPRHWRGKRVAVWGWRGLGARQQQCLRSFLNLKRSPLASGSLTGPLWCLLLTLGKDTFE